MIQIALVGETSIVVEEGIKKNVPEKLFILHTKNESKFKFEDKAKELKEKIELEYKIPTKLKKVGAVDMNNIISIILGIIMKEKKESKKSLQRKDFAINITGGTKAMVAAASTAAYLAGSRLYYVLDPKNFKGNDLVLELPVPSIPRNDDKGKTSKTSSIILELIGKFGKVNNSRLFDQLDMGNGKKCPHCKLIQGKHFDDAKKHFKSKHPMKGFVDGLTPQKLQYHLTKLQANDLITITRGWVTEIKDNFTGQYKTDYKQTTIEITNTGKYYAEFPDLVGTIL